MKEASVAFYSCQPGFGRNMEEVFVSRLGLDPDKQGRSSSSLLLLVPVKGNSNVLCYLKQVRA